MPYIWQNYLMSNTQQTNKTNKQTVAHFSKAGMHGIRVIP